MYSNAFPILSIWSGQAIFVLRLVVGIIFIVHGWPKLKDLRQTKADFVAMGFRPGVVWGTAVAILEFFGGLAVIFGIFVQPIALLFAVQMAVATLWKVKKGQGFAGGYELNVLLIASALALATLGGGAYALGPLFY